MTNNDDILIAANQIANTGKKPTVALIKAKLTSNIPLPAIITSLKTWQHDPSFITPSQDKKQAVIEANTDNIDTESLRIFVHKELKEMRQEITELKQLINTLIDQQNT